jgi:hypothetical protein
MRFPLNLSFKTLALSPQIFVRDSDGQLQLYVKQKLFKLKEAVNVFGDEAQTQLLYTLQADRVIDVRTRYHIRDASGVDLGQFRRKSVRSLWKLHCELSRGEQVVFDIREANPWVKVIDGLIGEIPVVGIFSGYFFHPTYNLMRPDGTVLLRATKQPALFEGKFTIEKLGETDPADEGLAVLGLLLMLLMERTRG